MSNHFVHHSVGFFFSDLTGNVYFFNNFILWTYNDTMAKRKFKFPLDIKSMQHFTLSSLFNLNYILLICAHCSFSCNIAHRTSLFRSYAHNKSTLMDFEYIQSFLQCGHQDCWTGDCQLQPFLDYVLLLGCIQSSVIVVEHIGHNSYPHYNDKTLPT